MSTIDLKHATIYLEDGYAGSTGELDALINHMAGYMVGATSVAIDTLAGVVTVGDRFQITGETDLPVHVITGKTDTLGVTVSFTFTPALTAVVADNAPIIWLPHQLEIDIGDGNCTYDESRTMEYKLNRGNLDSVREGDQVPMDVKIDANWEFLRSASGENVTIEEALKGVGAASTWITSDSDTCQPYSVNVIIDYIPPCADKRETITLPDYRYEKLSHDPKAGTISTSGKCNATQATVVRV